MIKTQKKQFVFFFCVVHLFVYLKTFEWVEKGAYCLVYGINNVYFSRWDKVDDQIHYSVTG